MRRITKKDKQGWLRWLEQYGTAEFLDAFLRTVEGAQSTCRYCNRAIYVDVMIGGGVPDWSTEKGDFGCDESPYTHEDGTGGHMPVKRS
jgi:hypothetical protein